MRITASELADKIGVELVGDGDIVLKGVARIENANRDEVTFVANQNYLKFLDSTEAGAIILREAPEEAKAAYLITSEPYVAFLKALRLFHPEPPSPPPGVHPSAIVADDVSIGKNVYIGPLCVLEDGVGIGDNTQLRAQVFLGRGVKVGSDCKLYSRVSVREKCIIGDRVILQDGVIVGGDGFGFAPQDQAYLKVPQVGNVVIEDDVEIGANSTIDRATLGETRIHRGAKIDNLVQIAHNVEIGEDTVIAAQSGIAGSTRLGRGVMLGGQVGIVGHLKISDEVKVAAQSGVHKDPGKGQIIGGYPARDIKLWHRVEAALSRLPDLARKIARLEKSLEKNTGKGNR